MWAFIVGLFGGRLLGNSRLPDSVKQQRWDAAQARKAREYSQAEHVIGNRGFWPVVLVLLALCVVGFLALALTR